MTENTDLSTIRYLQHHFWTLDQLADAVSGSPQVTRRLIDARCAPGAIYVVGNGECWSALDRKDRARPPGEMWYSRATAWGLRRALLATRGGCPDEEVARLLRDKFVREFITALETVPRAEQVFPSCFDENGIRLPDAVAVAEREWEAWLDGGYSVCLRVFNGLSCVVKETIAFAMRAGLETGQYDAENMLDLGEHLSGLILPFAPWERPSCTPGRTIDRLLSEQKLGWERPYARD